MAVTKTEDSPSAPVSVYRECQSLFRGLSLLEALNASSGGAASVADLARATGIHRTTVKRLLETLSCQGYVERRAGDDLYRFAVRVQALSIGFRDNVWIVSRARPFLRALGREVSWPCCLMTLEGIDLVVRDSTRAYSPFSLHPGLPGRRLPLLNTSGGRAYLAFCPEQEREALFSSLRDSSAENVRMLASSGPASFIASLNAIRALGYAVNLGGWAAEKRYGGIGVPIRHQGRVLAAMNVAFLLGRDQSKETVDKCVPPLLAAAHAIESTLDNAGSASGA